MPRKSRAVNQIKEQVSTIKSSIKKAERNIEELTERLAELEVYSSSSEEDLPELRTGDKVIPICEPHKGRVGTVISAGDYWVWIKPDWRVVGRGGRAPRKFKKARHNLQLVE